MRDWSSLPTTVCKPFSPAGLAATVTPMTQKPSSSDPDLDGYVDWIVYDRSWGAFSEDCTSLEEAQELAGRTGGGPVFRRMWVQER